MIRRYRRVPSRGNTLHPSSSPEAVMRRKCDPPAHVHLRVYHSRQVEVLLCGRPVRSTTPTTTREAEVTCPRCRQRMGVAA